MACPKCGGFVCYEADILGVEQGDDGVWIYRRAYCEDCDWTGYGRQWHEEITENYEDDVELPIGTGLAATGETES